MKRRDFITLVGGAAAGWPVAAHAQQSDRMRRIGFLIGVADDANSRAMYEAFRQGLQQLGWIDGRNVRIEARFGAGIPLAFENTQWNWSRFRRTSSWLLAALRHSSCFRKPARYRSSSPSFPTRSAPASSIASRNRAETRRASCSSNTA